MCLASADGGQWLWWAFWFFLVVCVCVWWNLDFWMAYKRWCENSVYMNFFGGSFSVGYYGHLKANFIQIKNGNSTVLFVCLFFFWLIGLNMCICTLYIYGRCGKIERRVCSSTRSSRPKLSNVSEQIKRKLMSNAFHFTSNTKLQENQHNCYIRYNKSTSKYGNGVFFNRHSTSFYMYAKVYIYHACDCFEHIFKIHDASDVQKWTKIDGKACAWVGWLW